MDAIIIGLVACIFCLFAKKPSNEMEISAVPTTELRPRLNESFYHDETAFMVVANELGFY